MVVNGFSVKSSVNIRRSKPLGRAGYSICLYHLNPQIFLLLLHPRLFRWRWALMERFIGHCNPRAPEQVRLNIIPANIVLAYYKLDAASLMRDCAFFNGPAHVRRSSKDVKNGHRMELEQSLRNLLSRRRRKSAARATSARFLRQIWMQ